MKCKEKINGMQFHYENINNFFTASGNVAYNTTGLHSAGCPGNEPASTRQPPNIAFHTNHTATYNNRRGTIGDHKYRDSYIQVDQLAFFS
jgi:hypothetical protein